MEMVIKSTEPISTQKFIVRKKYPLLKLNVISKAGPIRDKKNPDEGHSEKHFQYPIHDSVRTRVSTLYNTVDILNERLEELKSPYRIKIFMDDHEVYMIVTIKGKKGEICLSRKTIISESDFYRFIRNITELEGLIIDQKA